MRYFIALILLTIFAIGCSSSNTIQTSPIGNNWNAEFSSLPIFVSDRNPDGSPSQGQGLLGLFNLTIDKSSAELIPIRGTSHMDVLEVVDITHFLTLAPCANCVKLKGFSLTPDGYVSLSIGIKHPFPVGNPLMPISGRNRADLHVFNVEGIVISSSSALSFTQSSQSIADFKLVNADGYTGYLDSSIDTIYPTDATLHPYILHFDNYSAGNFNAANAMGFESVTIPPPSGNLVMAMGSDYDFQDYEFSVEPGEKINLLFTVGCSYAVSADNKNLRFSPEYRVPQHNKKAASEVKVEIITNRLQANNTSSEAQIEVHVVDLSHGVAVGTALNQMRADSSVSQITIEIPGLLNNIHTINGSSPISGSGHSPSDPLVYSATITNAINAPEGTYTGLVKVKDSYATGLNELALLEGKDGIERVDPTQNPLEGLIDIASFETYQMFKIDVAAQQSGIYVDNSYTGTIFEGTMAHPFITINDGIAAADPGMEVKVDDSGMPYEEQVNMRSDVIVISENWDTSDGADRAFIDGPDAMDSHSVLFDNVSNAVLSGFQIGMVGRGSVTPFSIRPVFVNAGAGNVVRNCHFTGNPNERRLRCIDALNTSTLLVEYCEFSDIDNPTSIYTALQVHGVYTQNSDSIVVKNNVFTKIGYTLNNETKTIKAFSFITSTNITIKNNLVHHLIPTGNPSSATNDVKSIYIEGSKDIVCANNTVDMIDVRNAAFIQQAWGYCFENGVSTTYSNVTFYNNIGTRMYSVQWPLPVGRGVQGMDLYSPYDPVETITCDYSCMWDLTDLYYSPAVEGTGCVSTDPLYIDSMSGIYDLQPSSLAQAGDPSILDWDDDNSGGNESRSRMGCHGGPDGEIVGLLN